MKQSSAMSDERPADDAALIEKLQEDLDALRYVLNWSESNTRVSTVMKTFTLPDRRTTKEKLEHLYASGVEALQPPEPIQDGSQNLGALTGSLMGFDPDRIGDLPERLFVAWIEEADDASIRVLNLLDEAANLLSDVRRAIR